MVLGHARAEFGLLPHPDCWPRPHCRHRPLPPLRKEMDRHGRLRGGLHWPGAALVSPRQSLRRKPLPPATHPSQPLPTRRRRPHRYGLAGPHPNQRLALPHPRTSQRPFPEVGCGVFAGRAHGILPLRQPIGDFGGLWHLQDAQTPNDVGRLSGRFCRHLPALARSLVWCALHAAPHSLPTSSCHCGGLGSPQVGPSTLQTALLGGVPLCVDGGRLDSTFGRHKVARR